MKTVQECSDRGQNNQEQNRAIADRRRIGFKLTLIVEQKRNKPKYQGILCALVCEAHWVPSSFSADTMDVILCGRRGGESGVLLHTQSISLSDQRNFILQHTDPFAANMKDIRMEVNGMRGED